jgi:hypothetical protein
MKDIGNTHVLLWVQITMYFIHVNIFQSTSLSDFIYFAGHQVSKQISIVRMVYCGIKVHYKVQTSVTSQLASHFKHLKAGGGGG